MLQFFMVSILEDGPFNIGDSPFWLGVVGLFAEAVEARTSYEHRKRSVNLNEQSSGVCWGIIGYIISSRPTIIVPCTECNVISLLPQWYYGGIQPHWRFNWIWNLLAYVVLKSTLRLLENITTIYSELYSPWRFYCDLTDF